MAGCEANPKVFVIVKIEGMCGPHAEELKEGIETAADFVISSYMRLRGGHANRLPIAPDSGTQH